MTISDVPINVEHEVGHVRVVGSAHGVIVAMTSVIISRRSQGPLDHAGQLQRKVEGACPLWSENFGCTDEPQHLASVGSKTSAVQLFQVNDEVYSKPQGKAAHDRHGLKPDTGNRSIRDFRGLDGNGDIDVVPPEVLGTFRFDMELHRYDVHCAIIPLGTPHSMISRMRR